MKTYFRLFLVVIITLTLSSCDKDSNNCQGIECLPPATQTGANTFGCLLDGQAFIPRGGINPLDCVYQFVDGGYYFGLQGNKRDNNNNLITLGVGTEDLEIQQGQSYNLLNESVGNAFGIYLFSTFTSKTSTTYTGELSITKLDTQNQIVSGTFWFDVLHPTTNLVVRIREGRFDMQYTQ